MSTLFRSALGVAVLSSLVLVGCASGASRTGSPATAPVASSGENAVVHTVSQQDREATRSKEPLQGSTATLWVNGLGCPQCATNIDLQLKRVRGVTDVSTDLGSGKVTIALAGGTKPTPHRLSEAVLDAGMTLVRIESH